MKNILHKTIVIVGPTASGKSDLAIALAKKYNGEIISADSRQVYRGMDIGTGKVTRDLSIPNTKYLIPNKKNKYISEGIRHHLLDVASPKRTYNVTHFIRDAKKALVDIHHRNKTAIICGGTGFWVQALIENNSFPAVKPNLELRKKLGKISVEKLYSMLEKKDSARAKTIDAKNKIRLIRALEICETLGKVPPLKKNQKSGNTNHEYIVIALSPKQGTLHKNMETRLRKRLKQGMVKEVETLRKNGLSWKRLESLGLEYRYVALFLQKKIFTKEMKEKLNFEIRHYAKRQITWLKRFEKMGTQIHWITDPKKAFKIIENK